MPTPNDPKKIACHEAPETLPSRVLILGRYQPRGKKSDGHGGPLKSVQIEIHLSPNPQRKWLILAYLRKEGVTLFRSVP